LLDWYPKDPSIEQDLVPIKSCKTCEYSVGTSICFFCGQLSNWKEGTVVQTEKEVEETVSEHIGKGGRLDVESQTGPCPNCQHLEFALDNLAKQFKAKCDESDRLAAILEKALEAMG
jgi:RNA polymerase subunit RPABC4/transcription elongation factor Spt4